MLPVTQRMCYAHAMRASEIKMLRDRIAPNQAEAAKLFGVSWRAWQDWERGATVPTGPALLLLKLAVDRPELIEWLRKQDVPIRPRGQKAR